MSRKIMLVILMVVCYMFAISGMASAAGIAGSKHDFSSYSGDQGVTNFARNFTSTPGGEGIQEPCVFCHTPHAAAPGGFLWNRTNYVATSYLMYSSSTWTGSESGPTGLTLMCMSCHDGITSIAVGDNGGTLINAPSPGTNPGDVSLVTVGAYQYIGEVYWQPGNFIIPGWGANIGNQMPESGSTQANLSDDHPVSFEWQIGMMPTGIIDPGNWVGEGATLLKLFGNNRMECSTCHNVHNNTNEPFLRMSNTGSNMCLTCHDK